MRGKLQNPRNRLDAQIWGVNTANGNLAYIIRRDGMRCAKCSRFTPFQTMDHIIRMRDGGHTDFDNLQILCLWCHRDKDNFLKGMIRI